MQAADEFLNNMKFAAHQQGGDYAPFAYGHVANYDPKTHRVRVVIVSSRNDDDVPTLSGWMTFGSFGGMQYGPMGGATTQNPTQGELVVVQRIDRGFGAQAVACLVWNQVNTPPFPELNPGEIGIKSPAGGSTILMDKNGNVTVTAPGNVTVNATGNLILQATSAAISAVGGTVQKLVTAAMVAFFNSHTHPANNAPPSQTMGNSELTSVLEAQ